jgi:hypothetical protein
LERSISSSACPLCRPAGADPPFAGAAGSAPSVAPIVMIGVPTGTVSPSGTRIAATGPANGDGSSTSDFAVSISTTTSLILTSSPTFTFQLTISASVSPSPTSGSL